MASPKFNICLLTGVFFIAACQVADQGSTPNQDALTPAPIMPTSPEAIQLTGSPDIQIPESKNGNDVVYKHNDQTLVKTAPKMLSVAMVIRPKADLREGPGSEYKLLDKVLAQHTRLLVTDEFGVWKKVLVRHTWESGWVHERAISKPVASTVPLDLPANILPTVITVQPVETILSFPHEQKISTSVNRGHMFRILRKSAEKILVWYEPTNHVFWISRTAVK